MANDDREDREDTSQPSDGPAERPGDGDESTSPISSPHVDEVWASCLRAIDAGQRPDIEELAGDDEALLAELRDLLDTSSWLEDRLDDEASTLRPNANTAEEETQAFVIQRGNSTPVGTLADIIRKLDDGEPYQFGEYELTEVIGRGGMGVVFRGQQTAIGREVAVKMIAAGRFASQADINRFYSEARAASAVKHPNIVTIYQVGEIDGHHFYSMDFVLGSDLAERLKDGPLPAREAATLMQEVATAVGAAHSLGVVHRDLKPGNILLAEDSQPHITDFGLAKLIDEEGDLTATGAAMGTPGYMPPEQATGCWHAVGEVSDVYSLGAILYAMLTGRAPFRAANPLDTMWAVVHETPARPSTINPDCDRDLETIALKCLEKDPLRRYGSAHELAEDLRRYLAGEPLVAKPISKTRRFKVWCAGIPVVAALSGRTIGEPSPAQLRAQAGLVLLILFIFIGVTLALFGSREGQRAMPSHIKIAGGIEGGMYLQFAERLGKNMQHQLELPVTVSPSSGSVDNVQQLHAGDVDLAFVQASALDGQRDAIVAAVFYEYVHVIVRRRLGLKTLTELEGRRVSLGNSNTGSRLTAKDLLAKARVTTAPDARNQPWTALRDDPTLDAAIVTVGSDNPTIREFLAGEFELLAIPDIDLDGPYASVSFPVDAYRGLVRPGLKSIRTPAFIVTTQDAADELVRSTLAALYSDSKLDVLPPSSRANWSLLNWHPAAIQYFEERTKREG